MRKQKIYSKVPKITAKTISGRRFFRRVKGLSSIDAAVIWRRFPRETRNKWADEAKGIRRNFEHLTTILHLRPEVRTYGESPL